MIIRENNVDELCRVINTLSEDIKAQIEGLFPSLMPPPSASFSSSSSYAAHAHYLKKVAKSDGSVNLLRTLSRGLDKTVSDAQERLSYCAEVKMRAEVQFFEPLPSQLNYPDIIDLHEEKRIEKAKARSLKKKEKEKGNNGDKDDEERHEEMGKFLPSFLPYSLLPSFLPCLSWPLPFSTCLLVILSHRLPAFLFVCLVVCLFVCLFGWLVGCLFGWLVGWLVGLLSVCLSVISCIPHLISI